MTRPNQPSRTPEDLRRHQAEYFARTARRSLSDAAAITVTWTRRQLIDVALTLAVDAAPEKPKAGPTLPAFLMPPRKLATLGPRRTAEEAAWTDRELRDAHAAWKRGERNDWSNRGHLIYQQLYQRRRRDRQAAS